MAATTADRVSLSPISISSVETVSFSLTIGITPILSNSLNVFLALWRLFSLTMVFSHQNLWCHMAVFIEKLPDRSSSSMPWPTEAQACSEPVPSDVHLIPGLFFQPIGTGWNKHHILALIAQITQNPHQLPSSSKVRSSGFRHKRRRSHFYDNSFILQILSVVVYS